MLHDLLLTVYYLVLGVSAIFLFGYLWILLEITLHELAHVFVGKLVGFRPYALTIGKGHPIFQRTVGGIAIKVHLNPLGGATYAQRPLSADLWWRGAFFSLAGIMIDVLLLVGLLLVRSRYNLEEMNGGFLKGLCAFLSPLAVYQGMLIVTNLYPHNIKRYGRIFPNDGRQFFGYISGQTQKILGTLTEEYTRNARQYDPEFVLETSWLVIGNHGSFSIFLDIERDMSKKDHEAAAAKYLNLLNLPTMTKSERAMFLDSLASIALVRSDLSFRERSIAWAKEAYGLFSTSPTLQGTYGSALIESGDYAKGVELLTPLTGDEANASDRAISSCYLAKAFFNLGDAEKAKMWMEKGKTSGLFPELASRIEAEMV